MNCDEVAESISALFDGSPLPDQAAEHLSSCELCRARLNDYAEISAELRRSASAVPVSEIPDPEWKFSKPAPARWFAAWRKTMRIPRFAFASMLVVILALAGGLAVVRARPENQGAFLLKLRVLPNGETARCALSIGESNRVEGDGEHSRKAHVDDFEPSAKCGLVHDFPPAGLKIAIMSRLLHVDRGRVEIGLKSKSVSPGEKLDLDRVFDGVPEATYWVNPREKRTISLPEGQSLEVSGMFLDHMPSLPFIPNDSFDPDPGELRIVSPVLLRDGHLVLNFSEASSVATSAAQLYVPGVGRFVFSSDPFEGAVEARVSVNQISLRIGGDNYLIVGGAPVTRAQRVWVLLQPQWRPPVNGSPPSKDFPFLGGGDLTAILGH